MRTILTAAILGAALAGPAAQAADVAPVYMAAPVYTAPPSHGHWLPACSSPFVLAHIPLRFAHYNARVIHAGVAIRHIDEARETGLAAGGPGLIDRRYCSATASLSDGSLSEVVYVIEGPKLGVASIGWHVESCLPGYDPYRVYDARCRAIRP